MTREEAKRRLLNIERSLPNTFRTKEDVRNFEALETAIKALEQEQKTDKLRGMTSIFDTLIVAFDSTEKHGSHLIVMQKVGNQFPLLKTASGEQAEILYHLLTEQMTKAEIKAESEGEE